MKTTFSILTGCLVLAAALTVGGCAGVHNQPGCCDYTEIIYVPVPVPYPDPIYIDESPPPPAPRPRPLPRPPVSNDGPRIKTPAPDRSPRQPDVVRGGSERPREQAVVHNPRQPVRKR